MAMAAKVVVEVAPSTRRRLHSQRERTCRLRRRVAKPRPRSRHSPPPRWRAMPAQGCTAPRLQDRLLPSPTLPTPHPQRQPPSDGRHSTSTAPLGRFCCRFRRHYLHHPHCQGAPKWPRLSGSPRRRFVRPRRWPMTSQLMLSTNPTHPHDHLRSLEQASSLRRRRRRRRRRRPRLWTS